MKEVTAQLILGLLVGRRRIGSNPDWNEVISETLRYRLGGLAWSLGPWPETVPTTVRDAWESAHRAQAVAGTLILEELDTLRVLFKDAQIPLGVIKGGQLLESKRYSLGARAADDLDVVVPSNMATRAVGLLEDAGWEPWSSDVRSTIGWCDSAAFYMSGQARALGLSVDLHWRTEYGRIRFGPNRPESEEVPAPEGWPDPENHLVWILEHFFKHLRYRSHLSALADALQVARGIEDWPRFESLLRQSEWGAPAKVLLVGLQAAAGENFIRSQEGGVSSALQARLDPARLVREAGRSRGRALGVAGRWALGGPRGAVRDIRDSLLPPRSWLESRYGPSRPGLKALLWARHVSRLVRWSAGAGPSPLSPNQE